MGSNEICSRHVWGHTFLYQYRRSRLKLQEIISDAASSRKLQMELAITIDAGENFVKSTYRLEGDGALAFIAYEEISKLRAAISIAHYPNVDAVAKKLAGGRPTQQQLTMPNLVYNPHMTKIWNRSERFSVRISICPLF